MQPAALKEALAQRKALGLKAPPRLSRAKALRAYYKEFYGADAPQGPDLAGCMEDYKASVAAIKGKPLTAVVKSICLECAGADDEPGGKRRVRLCNDRSCALNPVRPYQSKAPIKLAALSAGATP